MSIHAVAATSGQSSPETLGFLRMSAASARAFLVELRNGQSGIVATGDEAGTVQIEYESTIAGSVFAVGKPGERHTWRRLVLDRGFDMTGAVDALLADLGA